MKSAQRTERRLSFFRQTIRRRRGLLMEQLEARNLPCIVIPAIGDSPPDSCRSDNVSDDVGQVTYQVDRRLSISAPFDGCDLQLPLPIDAAENVSGSALASSEILDLPDIFDDYSDVPAQFRSSRVSDLLARAAFEFSERPPTVSVHDFVASDAWVTVRDGSALIQAVSTSVSGEKLGEFLAAMGGRVLGSFGPGVSAWFPLAQIPELGNLCDLTFASPVLLFTNKWPGSVTPEDGMLRTTQPGSGGLRVAEAGTCHDVHTAFPPPRVRESLALATIALPHRSPAVFGRDVTATAPWATAKDGFARMQAVSAPLVGEMLRESLTSNGGTMQGSRGPDMNAPRARQRIREVANLVDLTSAALVPDGAVTEELDLDRLLDLAERAGCLGVGGMRLPKA